MLEGLRYKNYQPYYHYYMHLAQVYYTLTITYLVDELYCYGGWRVVLHASGLLSESHWVCLKITLIKCGLQNLIILGVRFILGIFEGGG